MAADWVFDSLVGCLQSPMWRYPVDSFLDHHCVVFDPGEENKFSYTEVHKEYQTMVENLLESFTSDLGITPEMFTEACSQTGKLVEEHERNIDLELQALALLQKQLGHSPEAYKAGGGEPPRKSRSDEDDSILQEVLRQSQREFDLRNSLDEDELERLIEIAKEESLRLSQGEQKKMAEEMTEELERVSLLSDGGMNTSAVENSSLVAQQQQTSILGLKDDKSAVSKLEEQQASSVLALATTEVKSPPSLPTTEVKSPPPLPTTEVNSPPSLPTTEVKSPPPLPTTEVNSPPSLPSSATSPAKPEQRLHKTQSRDKPPRPQARQQERLKPVCPSASTSSAGSRSQLRELSGSEAAAQWLESAKSEVQQPTSGSSAVRELSGPSPEDLRAREAHLRQQRDHLLEMKRKARAQEFKAYTASQSSSASKSTQVAKSAARGELGLGQGGGGGGGGGQKRGSNTGVLCTAIAGRLKKELAAQENHS